MNSIYLVFKENLMDIKNSKKKVFPSFVCIGNNRDTHINYNIGDIKQSYGGSKQWEETIWLGIK